MGRNKVKPEQASKVLMRMLTLRSFGEGRTCGEVIDTRTHTIRRGSGHGTSEGWFRNRGRPVVGEGRGLDAAERAAAPAGVGQGHMTAEAG